MEKILSKEQINQFQKDGAIFLKGLFDISWIKKLEKGIEKDIKNPSPRFKSHTIEKGIPAYVEDYWTWDLVPEFKDFVFNSPYAKIAAELMSAKKINLVMDNWFLREGGSKSSTPFNHGGSVELIKENKNGILSKPLDIKEFSDNIRKCLTMTLNERQKLSTKSIRNVRKKYLTTMMCEKTLNLYKDLLSK